MAQEKVIYTDGRDVVVTDAALKVRHTSYLLNGITKFSFWTIRPDRWPAILLLLIGIGLVVCGYLNVFPGQVDMGLERVSNINMLAIWIGAGLALIGFIVLLVSRERYAVRIGTAEGEKNAVVSTHREYIAQIVDALHNAFDLGHAGRSVAP